MEKNIELVCCTGKTKENKAFTYFKAVQKDGKMVRVHFRQVDENKKPIIMPTASCMMKIDSTLLHYNTSKRYPELWVTGQPEYSDVVKASNKAVEDLF